MGAPPGTGSATSPTSPTTIPNLDPALPAKKTGAEVPPPASNEPPSAGFLQAPPSALQLMGVDEKRLQLGRGLRLYGGRHLDSAKLELKPLNDNGLALKVLDQIQTSEAIFHSRQLGLILKSLGQDAAQLDAYSAADREILTSALDGVESQLTISGGKNLTNAITAAKQGFNPDQQRVWTRFSEAQRVPLAELSETFLETDQALIAEDLLRLSELNRGRKLFGTAWTLSQLAAEYPTTEKRAKELSAYLEGKRTSTEYMISDMFDHGGSSIALDLLALIPSVALTRRLSTAGWLLKQRALVRVPLTLLAGGAIHWGSTKVLRVATGYDGKILPSSLKELGGELASSTLQNGLALFLSNRKWMWGRPGARGAASIEGNEAVKGAEALETSALRKRIALNGKSSAATLEAGAAENFGTKAPLPKLRLFAPQKVIKVGVSGLRAAGWTLKTGLKATLIGSTDILFIQLPLHYFKVRDMTRQGLSQYLLKLFPKTRETRLAVTETYAARRLFKDYHGQGKGISKMPNTIPGIERGLDLDLLLTQLDPSLEGPKREAAYAVLAEASSSDKLGLNIRRWILQKKKLGELAGANTTFQRQGIPLRYEADGSLCFRDSKDFACEHPPATKP